MSAAPAEPTATRAPLPKWAHPDFATAYAEGNVRPQFGWHQPRFLHAGRLEPNGQPSASPVVPSSVSTFEDDEARRPGGGNSRKAFFPPSRTVILTGGALDGASGCMNEELAAAERRLFAPLGQPPSVEELWDGPPLSDKLPPASDYERLLK